MKQQIKFLKNKTFDFIKRQAYKTGLIGYNQKDAPYAMKRHHLDFIDKISKAMDFSGKTVLEIGGCNFPSDILFGKLGVKKWVCVDFIDFWADKNTPTAIDKRNLETLSYKSGKFAVFDLNEAQEHFNDNRYIKFCGDASKIPSVFYEKFDIVVSNDAFEHIQPLEEVIEKIYLCLKRGNERKSLLPRCKTGFFEDRGRGGRLYAYFAPIFSGSHGNHYRLNNKANFNSMEQDGIPFFAHLIWNETEMRQYFKKHPLPQGQSQLDALCDWSYHNDGITRRLYIDYYDIMKKSSFTNFKMSSEWNIEPNEPTLKILKEKYPQNIVWANTAIIEAII